MENWERRLQEHGKGNSEAERLAVAQQEAQRESAAGMRGFMTYIDCVAPMFEELRGSIWKGGTLFQVHSGTAGWGSVSGGGLPGKDAPRWKKIIKSYEYRYGIEKYFQDSRGRESGGQTLFVTGSTTSEMNGFFYRLWLEGRAMRTSGGNVTQVTRESIYTSGANVRIHYKDQIQHLIDLDTQRRRQMGLI